MKIGVLRFPGTNCDRDVWQMVSARGHTPVWCWHKDHFEVSGLDAVIVPGGFSYGDYLRCGAMAAKSQAMTSVRAFAKAGKPVLGICNGFQVLCESGLLPGALIRNSNLRFIDDWVQVKLQNSAKGFLPQAKTGQRFNLPIAHGEGRFVCEKDQLKRLWDKDMVWFTYEDNPNGSLDDVAGVMNEKKNVMALMPHPERALFAWMGSQDGALFV